MFGAGSEMRGDSRQKVLARWRQKRAALFEESRTLAAAGAAAGGELGAVIKQMRALERAIKAYTEEKKGELTARHHRRRGKYH
jgi:hypothetical protein